MAIYNTTNNNTGGGDPNLGWFCEQGTCYQHPNGNLTYAQCKQMCTQYPCSMFAEACADYQAVLNGTSPHTMQYLVNHWVNMFALPQMGGINFTHTELGNYLLKCCYVAPTPRPPHSPRARILNRPVRENFYNIPTLNNKVKDWESVLGGVVAPKKSEYSMPNMNNPLISNQQRVFSNEPPSTYDNKAVTKIDNFTPYRNK